MSKMYYINLYYGWEETKYGIEHCFEALDPAGEKESEIEKYLAEQLDCDADSSKFNYDSTLIVIPQTLINRIKAAALREYCLAKVSSHTCPNCGNEFVDADKIYMDDLGLHAVCPECEGSFNVEM